MFLFLCEWISFRAAFPSSPGLLRWNPGVRDVAGRPFGSCHSFSSSHRLGNRAAACTMCGHGARVKGASPFPRQGNGHPRPSIRGPRSRARRGAGARAGRPAGEVSHAGTPEGAGACIFSRAAPGARPCFA